MKIFLGSGWYSTGERRKYKTHGSAVIRSIEIRNLWWAGVSKFIKPSVVVITDSASPLKIPPEELASNNLKIIELPINPGHAQDSVLHYCGWSASVILGLEFSYVSGADVFVYVEQDVLLRITNFEQELKSGFKNSDYIFGDGLNTPQVLQQSFFAIHRRGMRKFISRLHRIDIPDHKMSPEIKFQIASSKVYVFPILFLLLTLSTRLPWGRRFARKILSLFIQFSRNYSTWNFGPGRARPITFNKKDFYFQHGTLSEVEQFREIMLNGFR